MNHQARDLEPFEREWLASAGRDIGDLREGRATCPPLALLRAAHADALPEAARDAVAAHVAACHSCAVLQADLAAVPPETEVSASVEARILKDVRRKQRAEAADPGLVAAWWSWRSALAATALVAVAVAIGWQWQHRGAAPPGPVQAARTAQPGQAPESTSASAPVQAQADAAAATLPEAFRVVKPEVRLTLATLAWRGTDESGNRYLADLAPALDAFRQDRYADAAKLFEPLLSKYPSAVEVPFYLGVSRLLLGDNAGAAAALDRAAGLKADGFADDIQWYRGLARARAGDGRGARPLFAALCEADGARRASACAALEALPPGLQ
ncbi:MAG: tetratricopeptide repeat protein [Rhodospirillaceae bacterium]